MGAPGRRWAWFGLVASVVIVLVLTAWPSGPLDLSLRRFADHRDGLVPGYGIRHLGRHAARETIGNVLLYVPVGVFAAATRPTRRIAVPIGCCIALSLVVEAWQTLAMTSRVGNTDDMLLNVLGGTIGVVAVRVLRTQ